MGCCGSNCSFSSLDALRKCVQILSILEALFLVMKLCSSIGIISYYFYDCGTQEIQTHFCQFAHQLFTTNRFSSPFGIIAIICGILILTGIELFIALLKHSAVKNDNRSRLKMCFCLGVTTWLFGIILWLYLIHSSSALIFIVIFTYIYKYILLLFLHKYSNRLSITQNSKNCEPEIEVTKL